tara:strand:- start:1145 stop:1594 length:450 start_codon:yes stop_codon:yes gene_type:complete
MTQNLANIVMDGQSTTISIDDDDLQVISMSPPSISSGGEIDVTTMDNVAWRTKAPKKLKELGEISFSALYDPAKIGDFLGTGVDGVGYNKSIVITFADTTTLTFWGWVDSFAPSEISEGEAPTVDVTIIVSNHNGVGLAGGAETAPVYA